MVHKNLVKKMVVLSLALIGLALMNTSPLMANTLSSWSHGASHYEEVFGEAQDSASPLILYFHTDWCKWSKKFNSKILASWEVENFISDISKVEINPENGSAEKALKKKYGVRGYPTVLLCIPAISNKAVRVSTSMKSGNTSPESFIEEIQERVSKLYTKEAHACQKKGEYDDALSYLESALAYNSENAYAYYLTGYIYHTIGADEQDIELLEQAEENYEKALELDPDHKGATQELKTLTKYLESLE